MSDAGLLQQALGLAARGWRVFPCESKGKKPLVRDWPHVAATNFLDVTDIWRPFPEANIGVATGQSSGIFVLDVDGQVGTDSVLAWNARGQELPATLRVRTARGWHFYFAAPSDMNIHNSASKLAPGLDVRGNGGYVIAPPSIHETGAVYEFHDSGSPVLPAPDWLLDLLGNRAEVIADVETASAIPEGRRNNTLMRLAGSMRRRGASRSAIEDALLNENSERCLPPLSEAEVSEIACSVSRYEPARSKQAAGNRRPELLTLSDVVAREVDWLWKPYLALGMLAMLSGDPGAGKTFVSLAIAADVSTGRVPSTCDACTPGDVLYLSAENSPEHVVRPRFDSLGGDPARFHLLRGSVVGEGQQTERGCVRLSDVSLLRDALLNTQARLVIVDPIQSYLGAEVDAHRSNETRPVMDGLARLAEEHGCCILLVRHLSKAPTGKAIHRGLGSIDLTGAVRTELLAGCSPDDQTERALVQVKSNLGALGPAMGYTIDGDGKFRWTGESQLTAFTILSPESSEGETGALAEAKDFLSSALAQEARPAKDVQAEARQAGVSERTLTRAKRELAVGSRKGSMTGAWEWVLPEGCHIAPKIANK